MANWLVKLLVAATPISGPHFTSRKQSLSLARDDVVTFTIERTFAPFTLAALTDCKTSAVSPPWEMAIRTEFSSNDSQEYSNSLDMTASTRIFEYLDSICFA